MFKLLEANIDDIQMSEVVGPIELFTGKCTFCIDIMTLHTLGITLLFLSIYFASGSA